MSTASGGRQLNPSVHRNHKNCRKMLLMLMIHIIICDNIRWFDGGNTIYTSICPIIQVFAQL